MTAISAIVFMTCKHTPGERAKFSILIGIVGAVRQDSLVVSLLHKLSVWSSCFSSRRASCEAHLRLLAAFAKEKICYRYEVIIP
jgi:hypothetical protein